MSTAVIKLPQGTDVSRYATGFEPPVVGNLECWFEHFYDVARSARNFAPGKPDGRVGGNPQMGAGGKGIILDQPDAYIDTHLLEPDNFTFIQVIKPQLTYATPFSSSQGTRSSTDTVPAFGYLLQAFGASGVAYAQSYLGQYNGTVGSATGNSGVCGPIVLDGKDGNIIAQRVSEPDGDQKLINLSTMGAQSTRARVTGQRDKSANRPFRIGGAYVEEGAGTVLVYMTIIYSRVLSDPELVVLRDWIRNRMATFGLTA